MVPHIRTIIFLKALLLIHAHFALSYTILWGHRFLSSVHTPVSNELVKTLLDGVNNVIVFVQTPVEVYKRNNSFHVDQFLDGIKNQHVVIADKDEITCEWDKWNNTQVVTLDIFNHHTIIDAFTRTEVQHGNGDVLGILTTPTAKKDHVRVRRYASKHRKKYYTVTYRNKRNFLLRVTNSDITINSARYRFCDLNVNVVTDPEDRLAFTFSVMHKNVLISFNFPVEGNMWTMDSAEFHWLHEGYTILKVDKTIDFPKAPLGQYYECADETIFKNENITLKFEEIKVQPYPQGRTTFSTEGVSCPRPVANTLKVLALVLFIGSIGYYIGKAIHKRIKSKPPASIVQI